MFTFQRLEWNVWHFCLTEDWKRIINIVSTTNTHFLSTDKLTDSHFLRQEVEREGSDSKLRIHFNLTDILQHNSRSECYQILQCLRVTNRIERMCFFFSTHTRPSDPNSNPVGGGNVPINCLPTAIKARKRREVISVDPCGSVCSWHRVCPGAAESDMSGSSRLMRAVRVAQFGGPSVLTLCSDVTVPQPGHGQVRHTRHTLMCWRVWRSLMNTKVCHFTLCSHA